MMFGSPPAEMQGVFCRIRRRPPWGTWCTNPRKALFFRSLCTKSAALYGTRPRGTWCTNPRKALFLRSLCTKSAGCFSVRSRGTWCTNPPQSLILPFPLHQVCGLFRHAVAGKHALNHRLCDFCSKRSIINVSIFPTEEGDQKGEVLHEHKDFEDH